LPVKRRDLEGIFALTDVLFITMVLGMISG
jgi:hypothetical protein